MAQRTLFGTDGVRGVANVEPMTSETALRLGRALAYVSKRSNRRHRIVIGKASPISPYEVVRMGRKLGHTLLHLHDNLRVIHGDLKPSNLVLTHKPSDLWLIDFGSAWPIERSAYRELGDGFLHAYAAPELIRVELIDSRADQFSFGVILYQLLTGKIPYEGLGGEAGTAIPAKDAEKVWVNPSQSNPLIQTSIGTRYADLDLFVKKLCAVDRNDRFQSSTKFVEAIDRIWADLSIAANKSPESHFFYDRAAAVIRWLCKFRR